MFNLFKKKKKKKKKSIYSFLVRRRIFQYSYLNNNFYLILINEFN